MADHRSSYHECGRSLRRRAKEAYLIAERLKDGPFDSHEALLSALEHRRQNVSSLSDAEIDNYIGGQNPRRLGFFDRAEWQLGTVNLSECIVWPKMGERPWASGSVTEVAEMFQSKEPKENRIWRMQTFSDFFSSHLPIVVFGGGPLRFAIDDGSHRAVAMALTGRPSASAWIGRL